MERDERKMAWDKKVIKLLNIHGGDSAQKLMTRQDDEEAQNRRIKRNEMCAFGWSFNWKWGS